MTQASGTEPGHSLPRAGILAIMMLVVAAVWFGGLEHRKLVRPDEGRYSEIAREMHTTGDWVTPRLNGIKYFEKPPLQYWMTAAAFATFDKHHWTARLWPALTGFAGVLLTVFVGMRLFGPLAGLYGGLVLASAVGYTLIAQMATLDMGLTFFMTLALSGLLLGLRESARPAARAAWLLGGWCAMGLAVLSKGLIGIVLPGMAVAVYILVYRDWRLLGRLQIVSGTALFLIVTVPWFAAVSLANPEFFDFFFVHEHFSRFLTHAHRRVEPWWYFVPILLAGMLPWVPALPGAVKLAWQARRTATGFRQETFLLIWTGVIFIFFSISGSKLPSYILPVFPALALLTGRHLAATGARFVRMQIAFFAALAAVVAAATLLVGKMGKAEVPNALYQTYAPWIAAAGAVGLAGAAIAWWQCRRGRLTAALIAVGLCGLMGAHLIGRGHDSLSPSSSSFHIARQIKPHLDPDIPFYSVGTYPQTLPFYIDRTLTLVAFADEMAFGLEHEPSLWIPDYPEFERQWRAAPRALAVMTPQTYADLFQRGLPMREIARDPRRVVVETAHRPDPAVPPGEQSR